MSAQIIPMFNALESLMTRLQGKWREGDEPLFDQCARIRRNWSKLSAENAERLTPGVKKGQKRRKIQG